MQNSATPEGIIRGLLDMVRTHEPYEYPLNDEEGSGNISYISIYDYSIGDCEPLEGFSYLDSSSRAVRVGGVNIYIASLFMSGKVLLQVPPDPIAPFIAVQGPEDLLKCIESSYLSRAVKVRNPLGEYYLPDYKEDNISDELRLSIENVAISGSKLTVVDGPVFLTLPLDSMPAPYRGSYEKLIKERDPHLDRLGGIVKRISKSFKLYNGGKEWLKTIGKVVKAPDDVIVMRYLKPKENTPVFVERFLGMDKYWVYLNTGRGAVRVEAGKPDLLCSLLSLVKSDIGPRGIPLFIERADKMAKRLSSSTFLTALAEALKQGILPDYDSWETFYLAGV